MEAFEQEPGFIEVVEWLWPGSCLSCGGVIAAVRFAEGEEERCPLCGPVAFYCDTQPDGRLLSGFMSWPEFAIHVARKPLPPPALSVELQQAALATLVQFRPKRKRRRKPKT